MSLSFRPLHSRLRRMVGYLHAAIRNPRGFLAAARRLLARRSQAKKVLRQAQRVSDLPVLKVPLTGRNVANDFLAAFAQYFAILELRQTADLLHIGVSNADLLPLLQWLKRSHPQIALDPFENAACRKLLDSYVIDIELPRTGTERPFLLQVEPYTLDAQGRWRSQNSRNKIMRICYGNEFAARGLKQAEEILGAPLLSQSQETQPVDVVFTWVDYDDPEWQALYHQYRPHGAGGGSGKETTSDATSVTRFHNNDELRYALRSVWRNLSWINHIYILSNCRAPAWLDPGHDQITWVHHEEVIPTRFLPTFNSHVIESYLHHLPNLAEYFLYMNDDFFILRPQEHSAFYTLAGQSLARLEGYGMVSGTVRPEDPDYLNAARNSQALLRQHMGFSATELHSHVPYALIRSILTEIESHFFDPMESFRNNRFRTAEDLNIPSFLYHHYAMGIGQALPKRTSGVLVKCNDFGWRDRLARANQRKHDFVCINEGGTDAPPAGWHQEVRSHLNRWFPHPAPWER